MIELLKKAIKLYLGEPILNNILKEKENALRIYSEKKMVTIVFIDIIAFKSIPKVTNPEYLLNSLNIYFEKMSKCIINHNGYINQFISDAIIAIFGINQENHETEACNAVIDCFKILNEINTIIGIDNFIEIGVGINSDLVALGNIGSKYKIQYSAIGSAVNLTSRLVGLTKHYNVNTILTANTKNKLIEDFPIQFLDKIKVTGQNETLAIYKLIV